MGQCRGRVSATTASTLEDKASTALRDDAETTEAVAAAAVVVAINSITKDAAARQVNCCSLRLVGMVLQG
jgi:hypothetical protein